MNLEPIATTEGLDLSTPHVVAVIVAATVIGILGVGLRRFLTAYADELALLWRQYGPVALRRLLERRSMPETPWICARCRSYNPRATTRCYACGARREEAEAPVPDVDAPAGPSAGLATRTRRSG